MTNAEREVLDRIAARGWRVLTAGWPDALCTKDGEIIAVEVKRHLNDPLRASQLAMHGALRQIGLEVVIATADVWRPSRTLQSGASLWNTFARIQHPDAGELPVDDVDLSEYELSA